MAPKKLLILTSSGGGGLLQAAWAKEQLACEQDPQLQVIRRDVLKDWMWGWFGDFCINAWNTSQKRGAVRVQKFLIGSQSFFDFFSWPVFFLQMLKILFAEEVDRVVDTQTLGTAAILQALRFYNWRRGKSVLLEKVIVDLPTHATTHYFRPIKKLSPKQKKTLKIQTIAPLLEAGQTREKFWQKNCGISDAEIEYEDVTVRKAFRSLQGKPRSPRTALTFQLQSREEGDVIRKTLQKSSLCASFKERSMTLTIGPDDFVFTILLGSQPAGQATYHYVKGWLELASQMDFAKQPIRLFVFCSIFQPSSLFQRVANLCTHMENYPKQVAVIPFSFQQDELIAALFHRSDGTCTRSGGQTAMELMAVSSGEIWIHSESKKTGPETTLEALLEGIPGWESASALYLHKLHGAKIVTPEIFVSQARRLLVGSDDGQGLPNRALRLSRG